MIKIELVEAGDRHYPQVCSVAQKVYLEELGVSPTSFPPRYMTLFDGDSPVGGLGLWLGSEHDPLLTEAYCDESDLPSFFPSKAIPPRMQMGELCSFFLESGFRGTFFCALTAAMFEYSHRIGVRFILLIKIPTLTRQARYLGTELLVICKPDLEKYNGTEEEKEAWRKRYFRLDPQCCLIYLDQALDAYRSRKSCNPEFLPPFAWGDKMADIHSSCKQGG